ncbi:MAG: DEAD/DEAH box helicase [Acidobacteria bacterium]|nr:DEAD/DEAH box helicase [Acidobacteriota bacterium]
MTTSLKTASASGFSSLGLAPKLVASVTALGYEEPTPIQREAIPLLREGHDLIGLAGTGTGKTAAFTLPIIDRLAVRATHGPAGTRALVLVPTRELAIQVSEAIHTYAKGFPLNVVPLYGGAPMDQQIRALRRGADIVVATPGRALDHLRRRTLDLGVLEVLVLDEADEMLDMGFADDIDTIIAQAPDTRQTALFAATMAPRIAAIAGKHLKNPSRVTIAHEKRVAGTLPRIRQTAYVVGRGQKVAALGRILEFENPKSAIVFCRTRIEVDELTEKLNAHGFGAQGLHGGMEQKHRDRVMQMFRKEQADILVATDVAARGLDIEHVSHVINYDVPISPQVYVHRIGRTGRIGRDGIAITLADPREHRFLRSVEALTRQKIEILPLPSLADLRARRLDSTRDQLSARLAKGGLEEVRAIVEALAQDFDVFDVAAAAVTLVHEASESTLPAAEIASVPPHDHPRDRGRSGPREQARSGDRPVTRGGDRELPRVAKSRTRASEHVGPMAVLFVGAGKTAGIRPGDLVGAITGEADIPSHLLGAITITDTHALVEVPAALADSIVAALRATKIRGQRVTVRRDRG